MSSIELQDVCLDYIIQSGSPSIKQTIAKLLGSPLSRHREQLFNSTYRALNNINLSIRQGEIVGLIGKNGAGKSSLLRVLANIYQPSAGSIKIEGKISTLFNLNVGMQDEASGYENIINLSLLKGHTKKQAVDIIPDIERFTELGKFLNAPVRTYSAGMRMKLVFAVMTSFPSDILLIDEVIGAGDARFVNKSRERLFNFASQCNLIVLATHSNQMIMKYCNKVLVLDKGEIVHSGQPKDALAYYKKELVDC